MPKINSLCDQSPRAPFSNDLNIRAQLLHFSGINTAPDGRLGSNHANLSIMGCLGSRTRARVDNPDDRDLQFLFDRLQCGILSHSKIGSEPIAVGENNNSAPSSAIARAVSGNH